MGSILAETIEAERIEHVVKPVKNLFGAIFFVSVGMLIEPELLWQYKLPILFITLAVILGQILFSGFGILLSGQPLKIAIQSGFALAQIGEFAFIIASLGLSLKVTDNFLYPIVVAVSVITTFLTPYMIRLSEPAYVYADKHMPKSWRRFFDRYSSGGSTIKQKSTWNKLLKALMRIVVMYSAVSVVLILLWLRFVAPLIIRSTQGIFGEIISLVLILLIISPLLRAIMMKKNHSEEFQELWQDSKYNRGSLVSLIVLRIILCIGIVMIPIIKLLNITFGLVVAIAAASILVFILSKRLKKHSIQIERHFFRNLAARQEEMERRSPIKQHFANHLLARDLHLADFEIRQASPSVGKTLKELNFRQKCGVNVVTIIRGEQRINIPGGDERLYPFDKLIVVGTDKELESFLQYTEERYRQNQSVLQKEEVKEVSMEQFVISAGSKLIGLSIRQSGIRDNAACLVIGIERGVSSVMNPSPDTILEEGDIVWIVGERDKMVKLSEGEIVGS
jgi:CPA2 family monovalent cation:H+ antiporter-2